MDIDMELVVGTEDYEVIQRYFESRKYDYPSGIESMQDRIKNEYIMERWEDNEEETTNYKQRAIGRISAILETFSSNSEKQPISKT